MHHRRRARDTIATTNNADFIDTQPDRLFVPATDFVLFVLLHLAIWGSRPRTPMRLSRAAPRPDPRRGDWRQRRSHRCLGERQQTVPF